MLLLNIVCSSCLNLLDGITCAYQLGQLLISVAKQAQAPIKIEHENIH